MITQFIRKNKTEISARKKVKMQRVYKVGVLIAFKDDSNVIRIGWSAINTHSDDVFDKKIGLFLAKSNTVQIISPDVIARMPFKVKTEMPYFIQRCERFFKLKVLQ
jgi:hypothetical protein